MKSYYLKSHRKKSISFSSLLLLYKGIPIDEDIRVQCQRKYKMSCPVSFSRSYKTDCAGFKCVHVNRLDIVSCKCAKFQNDCRLFFQ